MEGDDPLVPCAPLLFSSFSFGIFPDIYLTLYLDRLCYGADDDEAYLIRY